MSRKPDEDADVALVERLVFERQSLNLERYTRAETLAGRTPDFKVLQAGTTAAYCEVKSPRDDWLDEQLDAARPFQIVGGLRSDPAFNRIARHVQKAASQFDAVNGNHDLPNMLVFVNHAEKIGISDMVETLTGSVRTESGETISTMKNIAERIEEAVLRIDLFVWVDKRTSRVWYRLNRHNPHHVSALCSLLGMERPAIRC